jgi:hypothetical protein
MKTCIERCALEFGTDLEGIFGRVVTRAECERLALDWARPRKAFASSMDGSLGGIDRDFFDQRRIIVVRGRFVHPL